MHDHDELLIIDLLDPSLSDEDVRARLEGCPECIADVVEQRSIMMLLDELPPATMTEVERHALHRQVDRELGSTNVVSLPGRWSWDWTRLGAVAAAMLGVFVIGGIVTSLGSGDDAGAPTTMVAAGEQATSRENESFAADSAESLEDSPTAEDGSGIASLVPENEFVRDLGPIDSTAFASEIEALSEEIRSLDESASGTLHGIGETCLDQIDDPSPLRGALIATVDGTPVVAFFDSDGTPTAFVTTDCSPYPLP